ncbi:MAG: hypothetical protein GX958_04115, partial [Desulfitobacterium sp.]|nr:hypothetical protein [Desulfitobacterium sp.]
QALATGASVVCTACPFCLTMFSDGIGAREAGETTKALDLAEVIAQGLN